MLEEADCKEPTLPVVLPGEAPVLAAGAAGVVAAGVVAAGAAVVAVAFGAAVAAGVGALTGWLTAGFVCAGAFVSGAFATACGFVSRFGSITACLRSAWCSLRLARFGFRCRRLLLGIAAMNWRNGGWFSWQRGVHHGSVNLFLILRLHQRVVQIALNLNTLLAFRRSWRGPESG